MTAKALILAGYGLNCEEETQHAFAFNGITADIMHINDLIDAPQTLGGYQILAIPGGFSYGDDTGSGNAFAQKMKLSLWDDVQKFIARDTLTIGICNGCQILTNLGLLPVAGKQYGTRDIAVTYNESARYQCRWIDIGMNADNTSPWLAGIDSMHIPVAHGEGRFMMAAETLKTMQDHNQIAARFIKNNGAPANGEFPYNPNGSVDDIAAVTDNSGKILAIMPHPERGMFSWQRDDFTEVKDAAMRAGNTLSETADGMALFANAARYYSVKAKK